MRQFFLLGTKRVSLLACWKFAADSLWSSCENHLSVGSVRLLVELFQLSLFVSTILTHGPAAWIKIGQGNTSAILRKLWALSLWWEHRPLNNKQRSSSRFCHRSWFLEHCRTSSCSLSSRPAISLEFVFMLHLWDVLRVSRLLLIIFFFIGFGFLLRKI